MLTPTYHCAFAIDDNYCKHFAATLVSLVENNPDAIFCCHVLASRVSTQNKKKIQNFQLKWLRLEVIFYDFDDQNYAHYRTDEHISFASYMRLFLGSTLPSHIDRLVYIDSDTIVLGSISELFSMPLGNAIVAAAPDAWPDDDKRERLQLSPSHVYFNAGVLVIDLSRWRNEAWETRLIDYVELNHNTLRYHDQDALNACLSGRVKYIDVKWNYQAWFSIEQLAPLGYDKAAFANLKNHERVIVHFMSRYKPWSVLSNVPLEQKYLHYARMTPWRKVAQPDRTLKALMKRHARELRARLKWN